MHTAITEPEISPDAATVLRVLGRSQWQRLYRVRLDAGLPLVRVSVALCELRRAGLAEHLDTGPGLVSWRRSGR